MKLAAKSAWMCASGAFLVTALPAFFREIAPVGLYAVPVDTLQGMAIVETIIFSLIGALMAGGIGYIIGDILGNPQAPAEAISADADAENAPSSLEEAGNETFLSDLEPVSATPLEEMLELSSLPEEAPPGEAEETPEVT